MKEPPRQGTVVKVRLVNVHEEAVHYLIGPEAVRQQGHLEGAVSHFLIYPAEGDIANNSQTGHTICLQKEKKKRKETMLL